MYKVNVLLNSYDFIILYNIIIAWRFAVSHSTMAVLLPEGLTIFFNNNNCPYNTTKFMFTLTSQFTIVCDTK